MQVRPESALSVVGLEASSAEDALQQLADRAHAAGFVDADYAAALITRERDYPTGLPTEVPVALPHADPDHVITPGLGVVTFAQPVPFGEMGGADSIVDARAAVLLVLDASHDRVELLTTLVEVFQRPGWFERLEDAATSDELADAFAALLTEG